MAELATRRFVGQQTGRKHLQRDIAPQALVAGAIYNAHATFSELSDDSITAEGLAVHCVTLPLKGRSGSERSYAEEPSKVELAPVYYVVLKFVFPSAAPT